MRQIIIKRAKPFKNLLLVLAIVLGSSPARPFEAVGIGTINGNNPFAGQIELTYEGTVTSNQTKGLLGIKVYIDTTIGVRYEVSNTITGSYSHVAIFYKFSKPDQTIVYNFITGKSFVNKASGPKDSDPNVDVVGNETVNTYSCTHLQHGGGTSEVSDYWMTPQLPGFSKLVNTLKKINPDMTAMAFSGTIFNWGGLVKWTVHFVDKQSGQTVNLELHLTEANTHVRLSAKTFDVPSK